MKKRYIVLIVLAVILLIAGLGIYKMYKFLGKLSVSDVSNYSEEYDKKDMQRFEFFPSEIPENATDVSFHSYSGMQSHEGGFMLQITLPEEEIEKYLEEYEDDLFVEEYYSQYPGAVYEFVDTEDKDRYVVYSDYQYGRGFIIDRETNTILFFYDEYKCVGDNVN